MWMWMCARGEGAGSLCFRLLRQGRTPLKSAAPRPCQMDRPVQTRPIIHAIPPNTNHKEACYARGGLSLHACYGLRTYPDHEQRACT